MTQVLVVGDLMTDAVARAEKALVKGSDTPSAVTMQGGGSGANIAAWLAVEGIDTAFVGRRGTDVTGRTRDIELMGYGVDARLVTDPDKPTGTCVVMVTHKGDLTMLSDPAANTALAPEDLPQELFGAGAHLHVSGYTLVRPESRPAGQTALELAAQHHLTASVDTASFAPLEHAGPDAFLEWTSTARLCLTTPAEARVLTGRDDEQEAARELAAHYGEVAMRLGTQEAMWLDDSGREPVRAESEHAASVVDPTGVGDAFCAGFLSAWHAGKSATDALSSGCRVAAAVLDHAGGRPPG